MANGQKTKLVEEKQPSDMNEKQLDIVRSFVNRKCKQSEKAMRTSLTDNFKSIANQVLFTVDGREITYGEFIAMKFIHQTANSEFVSGKELLALQELLGEKKIQNDVKVEGLEYYLSLLSNEESHNDK